MKGVRIEVETKSRYLLLPHHKVGTLEHSMFGSHFAHQWKMSSNKKKFFIILDVSCLSFENIFFQSVTCLLSLLIFFSSSSFSSSSSSF